MIPYAEFYNYDRLESAAVELGLLNTEADEENLLNLHNQLVWHLYRFDKNPRADAILYAVIEAILGEKAADITDVPWELRAFGKEVKEPMSLNEILASGGALLLFLTLVQITPIKVNPWSAVGKIIRNGMRAIGKSMNKDVMDKLESVQKELKDLGEKHNKLERRMDKDDADECRTRILRFADELRRDVKHSEEFFNQILDDISDYERYCAEHPEYKNSKAVNAIAEIDKVYQKCMEKNSFL